ncbi:hypothetical protein [Geodermatophilus normandii]|uniref:hypothetical protein n=1 Tax=Geodermatophilus normandii TaxID=1137989 RepID=UPI00195459FB|nr:hypothetical protein [Geodermatophilus normandii]
MPGCPRGSCGPSSTWGLEGGAAADGWTPTCTATFASLLCDELSRLEDQVRCLTRSRDAVRRYLDTVTVVEDAGEVLRA